jgi:hypothetical protein
VPKPTEEIMAWIATLSPSDELAARMAFCLNNPWCQENKPWQLRIAALKSNQVRSDEDSRHYEERAAKMARDIEGAVQEMKDQVAIPTAAPNTPT